MSADKPEVNDVFLHNFRKKRYVVFKVEGREVHFLFTIDGTPQHFSAILDRVLLDYTYLGKSIENVNNILQTEQDVANNVSKSDLQHSQDLIDNNIRKENMRLQAENNRLKKVLKDIFIIAKRNKSALLATPENNTLSLIENECALALIRESEEK